MDLIGNCWRVYSYHFDHQSVEQRPQRARALEDRLEIDADAEVAKVKTTLKLELDLTYLNHERFVEVRTMMGGRMFGTNELINCRETSENS